MITVSGSPLDMESFGEAYPQNSLQTYLLTEMENEPVRLNFQAPDELKFELDLRAAIVDSALKLNQSRLQFAVFRQSKCNPRYWRRYQNGGFQLLRNAPSSVAISDIYRNGHLYATECATAMVIVLYRALLKVFGSRAFNRIFSDIYLMNWHSLDPKIADFGALKPTACHLPGDRRYFMNPDVSPRTPEWQGENTIQLTHGRFYGHGVGIVSGEKIISSLNDARRPNAARPAFLRETVGRPNFDALYQLKSRF